MAEVPPNILNSICLDDEMGDIWLRYYLTFYFEQHIQDGCLDDEMGDIWLRYYLTF
jgi:hypothetical protein